MSVWRGHRPVGVLGAFVIFVAACSVDLAPLEKGSGGNHSTGAQGGTGAVSGSGGTTPLGGGGGTTPTGGAAGASGAAGGPPDPCVDFCKKVVAAGCSADNPTDCQSGCANDRTLFPKCGSVLETYLRCGAIDGTFQCNTSNYAEIQNCTDEWSAYWTCTWSFTPTCDGSAQTGGVCYSNSAACNPMTNQKCPGGQFCGFDTNSNAVQCYQVFPTAGECGACDYSNQNGPFCALGSECVGADNTGTPFKACARFCCNDDDCGSIAGSCISVGYYSDMKFCGKH